MGSLFFCILLANLTLFGCEAPETAGGLDAAHRFLEGGDYARAIDLLEEALSTSSLTNLERAELHAEMALAYLYAGDTDSVVHHLREATVLDPNEHTYHFNLASVLLDVNRPELSLRSAEMAVALDPSDIDGWRLVSAGAAKTGDFIRAEQAVSRAISIDSTQADLWNSYGSILMKNGRLPEAEDAFLRALSSENSQDIVLLNLISVARLQGDTLKAKEYSRLYRDGEGSTR